MNQPIYKINGKERRVLKKELSLMKHSYRMFWYYEDINDVYGCSLDKTIVNNQYNELKEKIDKLEYKLSRKLDREKKLERILYGNNIS